MENDMSLVSEIISYAIKENDIEVLLTLDNHDAIDMPNVEGDIPLVQCIKHDRRQIFELLLDYGAMLTADSDQPQPLDLLAAAGKMDWANKRLLGNPLGNPPMKTALRTTVAAKPRVLALVVEPDMLAWTTNMIEMWLGETHHLEVKVKRGHKAVYFLLVTISPRH